MKWGFLLLALVAPEISLAQAPGSTPARFFTTDRRTLPPAVQNIPLEHLSSGALMLLDRNGNLVKPPAPSRARLAPAAPQVAAALDPRVGSNLRLGNDPAALPQGMKAQAEPHIARSPVNPDFLVATFQEGRFTSGGAVDCGYSISTDGGLSWTRSLIQNLTQASGGPYFRATDPVAAVGLNGNVYLNTEAATDVNFNGGIILVSRSTNGGASFTAPVVVYQPPNATLFPDKPWMAVNTFAGTATANRILVTFTLFSNINNAGGSIQRSYSDDNGATWSAVANVNTNVNRAQGSQPVYLPNGNVVIVYWNFGNNQNPGERLEALISTNGGRTYGTPQLISAATEYNEPSIRSGSILPSAVSDRTNGYLYVVYQTLVAGNPRIVFTRSLNGGTTWSAPVSITDNPAGSGVFNPAINTSPDGQTLSVVFYDHRDNPGSDTLVDLYLAQSFNGGTTWQPNLRLTTVSTDATLAPLTGAGYMLGDYQGVAESTNANVPAVPVWIDTRTGDADPFIARVGMAPQLNFASWQAARLSLGQINNPALGGINGNADSDEKRNLLEYVMGTSPTTADTTSLAIEQVGSQFSVTYPRLKNVTDASVHAYRSADLFNWTNIGVTEMMVSDDGTIQTWRASTAASFSATFFRLQATQP